MMMMNMEDESIDTKLHNGSIIYNNNTQFGYYTQDYNNYSVPVSRKRSRDNNSYSNSQTMFLGQDIMIYHDVLLSESDQQHWSSINLSSPHSENVRLEIEAKRRKNSRTLIAALEEGLQHQLRAKEEEIRKMMKGSLFLLFRLPPWRMARAPTAVQGAAALPRLVAHIKRPPICLRSISKGGLAEAALTDCELFCFMLGSYNPVQVGGGRCGGVHSRDRLWQSIPHSCRMAFSHALAAALGKVAATPTSIEAWVKLLLLPRCTLRVFRPSNRQERRVLVSGMDDVYVRPDSQIVGHNIKQCLRKVSDGHFTAAVKVLCSSGVAPFGTDTLTALLAKHPFCPPPLCMGGALWFCSVYGHILAPHAVAQNRTLGISLFRLLLGAAIWRRLASKVAIRGVRKEMSKYLRDFQFGRVGVPKRRAECRASWRKIFFLILVSLRWALGAEGLAWASKLNIKKTEVFWQSCNGVKVKDGLFPRDIGRPTLGVKSWRRCFRLMSLAQFAARDNGFVAGQAVLKAESSKVAKHEKACLENQHVFIPFAFDTFGFLALEAEEFLNRVQRVVQSNFSTPKTQNFIFSRIGFAIQKGVAAQLVARLPAILL
ncbi:putative exostosin-like protein [Tanacetum coccineum]